MCRRSHCPACLSASTRAFWCGTMGRDCWIAVSPPTHREREREKFITRQPPTCGKDNYDRETSWISEGLPSSSRRRRRGEGRGEGGGGRETPQIVLVHHVFDEQKGLVKHSQCNICTRLAIALAIWSCSTGSSEWPQMLCTLWGARCVLIHLVQTCAVTAYCILGPSESPGAAAGRSQVQISTRAAVVLSCCLV